MQVSNKGMACSGLLFKIITLIVVLRMKSIEKTVEAGKPDCRRESRKQKGDQLGR